MGLNRAQINRIDELTGNLSSALWNASAYMSDGQGRRFNISGMLHEINQGRVGESIDDIVAGNARALRSYAIYNQMTPDDRRALSAYVTNYRTLRNYVGQFGMDAGALSNLLQSSGFSTHSANDGIIESRAERLEAALVTPMNQHIDRPRPQQVQIAPEAGTGGARTQIGAQQGSPMQIATREIMANWGYSQHRGEMNEALAAAGQGTLRDRSISLYRRAEAARLRGDEGEYRGSRAALVVVRRAEYIEGQRERGVESIAAVTRENMDGYFNAAYTRARNLAGGGAGEAIDRRASGDETPPPAQRRQQRPAQRPPAQRDRDEDETPPPTQRRRNGGAPGADRETPAPTDRRRDGTPGDRETPAPTDRRRDTADREQPAPTERRAGSDGEAPPAPRAPSNNRQVQRNQQAQLFMEELGISTGGRNHAAYGAGGRSLEHMDGIIGTLSRPALIQFQRENGIEPANGVVTLETLDKLEDAVVARRRSAENQTSATAALNSTQVAALTSTQLAAMNSTQLAALTDTQVATLTSTQISALTSTQLAVLNSTDVPAVTTTTQPALTSTQVQTLSSSQVQALNSTQVNLLTTTQINALGRVELPELSPELRRIADPYGLQEARERISRLGSDLPQLDSTRPFSLTPSSLSTIDLTRARIDTSSLLGTGVRTDLPRLDGSIGDTFGLNIDQSRLRFNADGTMNLNNPLAGLDRNPDGTLRLLNGTGRSNPFGLNLTTPVQLDSIQIAPLSPELERIVDPYGLQRAQRQIDALGSSLPTINLTTVPNQSQQAQTTPAEGIDVTGQIGLTRQ